MSDVVRLPLFWLAVGLLLLFAAYRGYAAWLATSHEHHLTVAGGFTVRPILDPDNFPPLEDLDPASFDVAPDGSFVFKQGARLVVCDPAGDEPALSVLVEQEGLDAFAFDAGGALFTVSGGVLGMYVGDAPDAPPSSRPIKKVSYDVGGPPMFRLISPAEAAALQRRGFSGTGWRGSGGHGAGAGGRYGGSGSSSSGEDWRLSEYFFTPPDERVSEAAVGAPPPPEDGRRTFVISFPPEKPLPSPSPQRQLEDTFLLPSTAMRLARTSRPGELLLYGGNNPNVYGEVHLLKAEGTAEWLVSSSQPVTLAAEAGGNLYLATGYTYERDSRFEVSSSAIVRFPLGNEQENSPKLVFTAEALGPEESIQSIAADPGGRVVYFSTDRKVYAINGLVVVRILDGLGGILRARGDMLYVFNAKRRVLLGLKKGG